MRAGEFPDGAHVLRARIDMAHPNMLMRDPLLLRIRHAAHYRRGTEWCVYPLYDFAHGLSDAFEGITHSLCTLEFKDNRELYDWLVREAGFERPPEQTEFARLELDYTVLSKRKLLQLVTEGHVTGWDDPRMPTLAGLRRRGVTPEAIRAFADTIGVARSDARIELATFEHAVRDDLNMRVPARDGGNPAAQAGAHQLSRGPGRDARRAAVPTRRPQDRVAAGAVQPGALDRAGRLHGGRAEEVLPADARAGRCGCGTATWSPVPGS